MATITELLIAELDREMAGTRRALERVPEGRDGWSPTRSPCRSATWPG